MSLCLKDLAHDLSAALYRLLSKRNPVLRSGAMSVALALLPAFTPSSSSTRPIETTIDSADGGQLAGLDRIVGGDGGGGVGGYCYREMFERHGVMKLVRKGRSWFLVSWMATGVLEGEGWGVCVFLLFFDHFLGDLNSF